MGVARGGMGGVFAGLTEGLSTFLFSPFRSRLRLFARGGDASGPGGTEVPSVRQKPTHPIL